MPRQYAGKRLKYSDHFPDFRHTVRRVVLRAIVSRVEFRCWADSRNLGRLRWALIWQEQRQLLDRVQCGITCVSSFIVCAAICKGVTGNNASHKWRRQAAFFGCKAETI